MNQTHKIFCLKLEAIRDLNLLQTEVAGSACEQNVDVRHDDVHGAEQLVSNQAQKLCLYPVDLFAGDFLSAQSFLDRRLDDIAIKKRDDEKERKSQENRGICRARFVRCRQQGQAVNEGDQHGAKDDLVELLAKGRDDDDEEIHQVEVRPRLAAKDQS